MSQKSGFAWITASDADISRARALLHAITPRGVLDELGFLVLLGSLSDRLYPATNTIMTRARYLVFLPAVFRHLEAERLAVKKDADRISRDWQDKLRAALVEREAETAGVIGRDKKRNIVRPPSNIYWNALLELGITTAHMSESAYLDRLSSGSREQELMKDEDGAIHELSDEPFWDPSLHTSSILAEDGTFAPSISFSLTAHEAKQLRARFELLPGDGALSLLSHQVEWARKFRITQLEFAYPWDVPDLPIELRAIVHHAKLLSLLAGGARLQYHALLFKKRRAEDPGTGNAFAGWWNEYRELLADWDLDAFFAEPCVARALRHGDLGFLRTWRDLIVSCQSGLAAYRSAEARICLGERERMMRGARGRLQSEYHLNEWEAPTDYDLRDYFQLSYRHRVGQRFAQDILDGLALESA